MMGWMERSTDGLVGVSMSKSPILNYAEIMLRLTVCGLLIASLSLVAKAQSSSIDEKQHSQQRHDMILMLPKGPVHLRVDITAGGRGLLQLRQDYLASLMVSLDTDKDGRLSRDETSGHPLFTNGRRFEDNSFLQSLRSSRRYSDRDVAMTVDRAAGQLVSYRQDNQLADQDLRVFKVLDSDGSGLIEPAEMRMAASAIAGRDSDFDQCVTFDEFLLEDGGTDRSLGINVTPQEPPGAVHSEWLRSADEPILPARLVRRYDTDRDAHLTAEELSWDADRVAKLDADGDGKLTMQELSGIADSVPDMALTVDLDQPAGTAMKPIGETPASAKLSARI